MNDNTDPIGDFLDLPDENVTEVHDENTLPSNLHSKLPATATNVDRDIKYVRDNLYELIESGQTSFDQLLQIAQQSQHPRAFEVVSTMLKQLVEANKELLDVHKKKKEITEQPKEGSGGGNRTVNNTLIVGSTADLQKALEKAEESRSKE